MTQIIETDAVVIGGGMTGAGILRDLAASGIKAILVEQQDLGHGSSTRNHGLLHSGCRYVVRDEDAAIESYHENLILKKTLAGAIDETGGLYVKVPEDDDAYVKKWVDSNKKVGIPIEEIPVAEALKREPYLNKNIQAAFLTPDGALDPFVMVTDIVADAITRGAKALTYHKAVRMLRNQNRVTGVIVQNAHTGEEKEIHANIVINSAGPWSGQVAGLADVPLHMINNRGMLVIFGHRFNKHGIFRLRKPGDAEAFIPTRNVTIFGTTGVNTDDPNDTSMDRKEMEEMLIEGIPLVPKILEMRLIRAFSGNRPLYQESAEADPTGRNVTRGMALLDHKERDNLEGFVTITGGKLTTFRYMAEKTVDLVCEKLGVTAKCTTHEEVVPHRDAKEFFNNIDMAPAARNKIIHWAGNRAKAIEDTMKKEEVNTVICECEQVSWAEIQSVIPQGEEFNIGGIRRRTRLGMGPCQGTFCNFRAAAISAEKGITSAEKASKALHNAVLERKKGMGVVATGETAKQLQLMESIYRISLGLREEDVANV